MIKQRFVGPAIRGVLKEQLPPNGSAWMYCESLDKDVQVLAMDWVYVALQKGSTIVAHLDDNSGHYYTTCWSEQPWPSQEEMRQVFDRMIEE